MRNGAIVLSYEISSMWIADTRHGVVYLCKRWQALYQSLLETAGNWIYKLSHGYVESVCLCFLSTRLQNDVKLQLFSDITDDGKLSPLEQDTQTPELSSIAHSTTRSPLWMILSWAWNDRCIFIVISMWWHCTQTSHFLHVVHMEKTACPTSTPTLLSALQIVQSSCQHASSILLRGLRRSVDLLFSATSFFFSLHF